MTTTQLVAPAVHPAATSSLPRAFLPALLLAIVMPRAPQAADATWAEFAPPTRIDHAAIYDPIRDRMLVFGGRQGCVLSASVMALSLAGPPAWTEVAAEGPGPSARRGHSVIYDPIRDRAILFGGNDGINVGDLWTFSLNGTPQWSLLTAAGTPPGARAQHTAVYDPIADRMLLFGGSLANDTWELTLGSTPTWTQIVPTGGLPPGMNEPSAIFDPTRNRMLVLKGTNMQLWQLDLSVSPTWTDITPAGPQPQARFGQTATYDPVRDRMLLLGGTWGNGHDYGIHDCWALPLSPGSSWQALPNHSRWWHSAIYDPVRDCVLVFGGQEGAIGAFGSREDNGTWKLSLTSPSWQPYFESQAPIISNHTAVYDPDGDRMLVYGGLQWAFISDISPTGGLWTYSLGENPSWNYVNSASDRGDHSAIHDPVRNRMLVFGGDPYYGQRFNDVGALSLPSLQWSAVSTTGTPPAKRRSHTAIYDPARDRMIVFGGIDAPMWVPPAGPRMNDTWALGLGNNAWTQLNPLGTPPSARENHTAIYDPLGDRMLVFGGHDAAGPKNDLWELSLAGQEAWTQLTPAGTPPSPREMHTAVYDAYADRMLVFGGDASSTVWGLDLSDPEGPGTWSALDVEGPPVGRKEHTMVLDPTGYRLTVFGGERCGGYGPEVFGLDLGEAPVGISDAPPVADLALRVLSNPTERDITVAFRLSSPAQTVLELIDVSGRCVGRRDLGTAPAGPHTVVFDDRRTAGVYFVRLTHAARSIIAKVTLLPR